jgi:hypothetical protein
MAYGRKRPTRPARKGGKGVSRLLKKPATAVTTLAKAVKSIQLKMKQKTIYLQYGQGFDTNLSSPVDIFKLSNYSNWQPIFGAAANDATANKMIHKSFGLDMFLNSSNETDSIQFTIFLVSLKDDMRGGGFNNTSGALSLSNGIDYYQLQGLTLLNKSQFNIHAIKRCVLGNNGVGLGSSTAQTQYGTDRRFYMKQRCNKTIVGTPNVGDWKSMDCSQDPSDNYYLLIFNDNGILDAENPRVRINVVHSIEQLA